MRVHCIRVAEYDMIAVIDSSVAYYVKGLFYLMNGNVSHRIIRTGVTASLKDKCLNGPRLRKHYRPRMK